MGERGHTKGPWRVDNNHAHYVVCDHAPMVVAVCGSSLSQQDREANARLIAAAPDLYAALKMAVDHDALDGDPQALEAARAALSKATPTGEASDV